MPLIVVTGYPCIGKTKFANLLSSYLKQNSSSNCTVSIVNEETINISHGYENSAAEKKTRGTIKSEVHHLLNHNAVVIVDSTSTYIKGFRYELFCIARTVRTSYCVCWVDTNMSSSIQWNLERYQANPTNRYEINLYHELRRRFEPPNEKNRWDSPLFKIFNTEDVSTKISPPSTTIGDDIKVDSLQPSHQPPIPSPLIASIATDTEGKTAPEEPVIKSSWKPKSKTASKAAISSSNSVVSSILALTHDTFPDDMTHLTISGSKVNNNISNHSFNITYSSACEMIALTLMEQKDLPMPNLSTVSMPNATPEMLYEADRITQEITQRINAHQKDHGEGTPIVMDKFQRSLVLHRFISPTELDRIRRQFVKTAGQSSERETASIGGLFIDFLSSQV